MTVWQLASRLLLLILRGRGGDQVVIHVYEPPSDLAVFAVLPTASWPARETAILARRSAE